VKKLLPVLFAFLALSLATVASAQDIENSKNQKWRLGFGVSTAGPTIEASYRFSPHWAVRGFHGFGVEEVKAKIRGGILYEEQSNLQGTSLSFDYYPFANRLRLTGGAIYRPAEYRGRANGSFQVGNNFYTTSLTLKARTELDVTPYLAVGYEQPINQHLVLVGQLGALYSDGVNVTLRNSGGAVVSLPDIIAERVQAESDFDKWLPFASIMLMYQF